MELIRRSAFLTCIIITILLNWLTYVTPVFRISKLDFREEQKLLAETSNYFKMNDKGAYLSQLPLNEFISEYTKGKTVTVSGPDWEKFFEELKSANQGRNWGNRKSYKGIFLFRPDEKPLVDLKLKFSANNQTFYHSEESYMLELKKGTSSEFIKLEYYYYSDKDNYHWGSVPDFFYPYRIFSIFFIVLGFAVYIFIPWPKREKNDIYYTRIKAIANDFGTYILIILCLLIPFFIHHSTLIASMDSSSYIFWVLSAIGFLILRRNAWISSFKIHLNEDRFSVETYKGVVDYLYQDIENYHSIQRIKTVGTESDIRTVAHYGISINFTNQRILNIWMINPMGNDILKGTRAVQLMFTEIGLKIDPKEETIKDFSLPIGTYDEEIKVINNSVFGSHRRLNVRYLLMAILILSAIGLNLYYYWKASSAQELGKQMASENIEVNAKKLQASDSIKEMMINKPILADYDVKWVKIFGKSEITEYGSKIFQVKDGGFLILGTSERKFQSLFNVNTDIFIIKLDRKYNWEWEKIIVHEEKDEFVNDVVQLNDGSFVFVGNLLDQIYLLKLDSKGEIKWDRQLGRSQEKYFVFVEENYLDRYERLKKEAEAAGKDPFEYYSDDIRANSPKLRVTVTVDFTCTGKKIKQDGKNNFVLLGLTAPEKTDMYNSNVRFDEVSYIKTNANGDSLISASYSIFDSTDLKGKPRVNSIEATRDGGFVVNAEITLKNDKYIDIFLIKFDKSGKRVWKKYYGGKQRDIAKNVYQTRDDGYLIIGTTFFPDEKKLYVIRIDSEGNVIWENRFGDKYSKEGIYAEQTKNNGFIILGNFESSRDYEQPGLYILKVNLMGAKIWEKYLIDKTVPQSDQSNNVRTFYSGNYIIQTSDHGYLITGKLLRYFNKQSWEADQFVMKIKEPD